MVQHYPIFLWTTLLGCIPPFVGCVCEALQERECIIPLFSSWRWTAARNPPHIADHLSPFSFRLVHQPQYKLAIIAALVASASAFAPATPIARTTAINQEIGKGGMADTRDPEPYKDEDPRKSISAAPSFEEYLKQRQAEGK